jgi:hypothetical protein
LYDYYLAVGAAENSDIPAKNIAKNRPKAVKIIALGA